MNVTPPPRGAQAALRAIRLLKAFTPDRPEQSLGDLSARLGLNKSTAHRLLAALESESLVERDPERGTYRLGAGTVALGVQALAGSDLRSRVHPVLERLAALSGETATLEVLVEDNVVILDEVEGRHMVGTGGHTGTRWAAHATSTGKAILAAVTEEWPVPAESTLPAFTAQTMTSPERLSEGLAAVRRRGYATAVDELEEGFTGVAAAFCDPDGRVRGALSLSGPTSRLTVRRRAELGRLLAAEAQALSGMA
ncbi:MAG: IclR family transcriptional regulator [Gammaproteobacteria bacterium]